MIYHDDELDNELKNNLNLIASTPPRNLEKATHGREVFMNKVKEMQTRAPQTMTLKLSSNKLLKTLFGKRTSLAPFAIAFLVAIGLIFGGWGTVFAAQDSLPNDFLYPVKLAAENVRFTITTDSDAKVALLLTNLDSRIDEATTLAALGTPIPEELPTLVDEKTDELFSLIAGLDEESMQEALKGVQIHDRDQIQDMTNAMNRLPEGKDPQLARLLNMAKERQHLVQMGVGEPNTFQQQFRHQLGKPTLPITPTLTSTLTSTITTTLTTTPEITVTLTITNGHYGPGPCETPGDCMPPGPHETPIPGEQNGYGPGEDQGVGPNQPTITPMNSTKPGGTKNKNGK